MKKAVLAILIILVGSLFVASSEADAATKKVMYVNAKSDIVLRAKSAQNAERLGTIKNHAQLTVLSSSKGWSYVQIGKNKGYVYSSALSKKNPKVAIAPTTVTKGLTPVNGLILTYSPSFNQVKKETFHVKEDGKYTYLFKKRSPLYTDLADYTYVEDKYRLMMGELSSSFAFMDLPYPLKQGTYTIEAVSDERVLVESTTKTIKVKAGSFRNVVILRYTDGYRIYFAKGIGIIKSTDDKGKILMELTSLKTGK